MFGNIQRDMAYANMATRQTSATGKSATTYHTGGFRQVSSLVEYQQSPDFWAQVPLQTVPSFPIGPIATATTIVAPCISISGDGKVLAYAYIFSTNSLPVLEIYESPKYDYAITFTNTPADATVLDPLDILNDIVISCTLSKDGSTCVLGYSGNDNGVGAIWTYYNPGTGWQQTSATKIIPSGIIGTKPFFGFSLALSNDKSTLVVGAPSEGFVVDPTFYPGAVFVYKLTATAGQYSQFGTKIVGPNLTNWAYQGYSVSVSANGSLLLFGAPYDGYDPPTQPLPIGAALLFRQSSPSGTYIQEGTKLTLSTPTYAYGISCALTSDGTTAYVGSPFSPFGINPDSGVYVYTMAQPSGGDWIQQGFIGFPRSVVGVATVFGGGIAVSEDGNTVAISSVSDIVTSTLKGSAYIFSKGGNFTYTQNGPKLYNSAFTTSFTNTIALSADGKVLATAGFQPTCALLVYISL
jgi:hypothetical protein